MPTFNAKGWLIMGMTAAIALACYPTLSAVWAAHISQNRESSAISRIDDVDAETRLALLEQAKAYNARLAGEEAKAAIAPYEKQLRCAGIPEMCWLDFPKADIHVPVYHGTDDATLMKGAGHLEDSALPVGGRGTHCVITGHSGMRGTLIFDNLTHAVVGDVFTLHVLGKQRHYRVIDIRTVSPNDVDSLEPQQNRDLCTLVTCSSSPTYGDSLSRLNDFITRKNDLRLLVTGERCARKPQTESQSMRNESQWTPAIYAPAFLVAGFAGFRLVAWTRRTRRWQWRLTSARKRRTK